VKKSEVTERLKELMTDADRQQLFNEPPSLGHPIHDSKHSAGEDYLFETEKQEHTKLENWLNQYELFYNHERMDKRTSNRKGIPDFIIGICGLMVCIEFKLHGRKLTEEQEEWRRKAMHKSRVQYHVMDNAGDAIRLLQGI
jgi:hypothetical protein